MSLEQYMEVIARKYILLFSMLLDHGIDTILSPAFGDELLTRGEAVCQCIAHAWGCPSLERLILWLFYRQYDTRVRISTENYPETLEQTHVIGPCWIFWKIISTPDQFSCTTPFIFWAYIANDATQQVGKLAIEFYLKEKRLPKRREIVSEYYGEYVEPATIFIGFEKPAVF